MKIIEGKLSLTKASIAIVASRFNSFIVSQLENGAIDALQRSGIAEKDISVIRVPGAYEIPLILKQVASQKKYDGIIALGAVIRGATPHFDYVAGECVKGISQVAMSSNIPIAFGVLTVDTIEQAIERAGTKAGNKGEEAARTLIEMISLMQQLNHVR